jgi:hypothetical protein
LARRKPGRAGIGFAGAGTRSRLGREPVGASAALENRLLDDFDRVTRRWSWARLARAAAERVWPGAPLWQPACAFALAFGVGLGVAAFAPLDVVPPDDRAVGAFTLDAAPDTDAGQDI